jgi:UDP-3-O-[3-hydroxymyristoyl] glucosamine N-acyltransferase
MPFTAAEIAQELGGELKGDGSVLLRGFAPADKAKSGDLTFAENEAYFLRAEQSAAHAILVDGPFHSETKTVIRVPNARIAFARAIPIFFPEPTFAPGTHPTSVIALSASVDPTAHIGPFCVVGERARIEARVVLEGGNHVGEDGVIAEDAHLFPRVVLYARTQVGKRVRIHAGTVVGSDGFGYVPDSGMHRKVAQVGNVILHDDVELGANVTIDRGALGATVVGKGTKVDNLVQIGHNVVIGDHCIIIAQVGVAGSTRLGNRVTLAGQVGLAGHLKIGNQATIAAQSGVMNDIPDGGKWMGSPAQPDRQAKRQILAVQQLPALLRRIKELERRVGGVTKPPPRPLPAAPDQPAANGGEVA